MYLSVNVLVSSLSTAKERTKERKGKAGKWKENENKEERERKGMQEKGKRRKRKETKAGWWSLILFSYNAHQDKSLYVDDRFF